MIHLFYKTEPEINREDLLADLTGVIYWLCARRDVQRRAKLKAATIVKQVEEICGSSNNTSSAKAIPVTPRLTPTQSE